MPNRHAITAAEFARAFHHAVVDYRSRFAFFLGAGCSASSKIPLAGDLVRDHWLPKLMYQRTGGKGDVHAWAAEYYPGYTPQAAAQFYGPVIGQLFRPADLRQREIDRIVSGREPAYGYSALAKLLTHEEAGKCCNVVLTTNFDDLVADALYLYGNARPLVIGHEALIGFARVTRAAPLVIKLHGDHQLAPKNTRLETSQLADSVKSALRGLLSESGLVFIGYSGADQSIAEALSSLPEDSLPCGVYWVNDSWPDGDLGAWLHSRDATWVKHRDFDEVMLLLDVEFNLGIPDDNRFRRLMDEHRQTFETLYKRLIADDEPEKAPLKEAAREVARRFPSARAALMAAYAKEKEAPDEAEILYREAIKEHPGDAELLGQFAYFLESVRKYYDEAENFYRRSIEIDQSNVASVGNYAHFLKIVRKAYDEAERFYRVALEIDPRNPITLGGFANFMADVRKYYDEAERYYRAALEADPKNARNLGNFAVFLNDVRNAYDEAEQYYRAALEADPKDATNLGNFAVFLKNDRHAYDEAERCYRAALEMDSKDADNLGNLAGYLFTRGRHDEANTILQRCEAEERSPELALECQFYRLCHVSLDAERGNDLRFIAEGLRNEVRSRGFDLPGNVARAVVDGHPWADLLDALAKVITDEAELSSLDRFPEWQAALSETA